MKRYIKLTCLTLLSTANICELVAASDVTANRLFVQSTQDADAGNANGAAIVGNPNGTNVAIDSNEIMARNNSTAATLHLNAGGGTVRIGNNTSKVGIGTATPFTRLDVIGTVGGGDHYFNVRNHTTANHSSSGIALINSTASNSIAGAQILSTRRTSASDIDFNVKIYDGNGFNQRLTILGPSGNVGIGTTSPSHKLAVNGTIRAKEVIVETGWSDYVFEEDYILAPLSEVEAHIEEKGHLPGIPSAAEIEANGAKLSELVTLQMAKIEELTLHIIAQEKRAKSQEARIQILEQKLTTR